MEKGKGVTNARQRDVRPDILEEKEEGKPSEKGN